MALSDPREAQQRVNDVQQSVTDAVLFFPGAQHYRACFAGDSWFVVREVDPEEDAGSLWPGFCGHIYALASIAQEIEAGLGSPGIRVIASHGQLLPLEEPDGWQDPAISAETARWFALTGINEALLKCGAAERAGSEGGFRGGFFWHERPTSDYQYWGTPFLRIPVRTYCDESQYPMFYEVLCSEHTEVTVLEAKYLRK